MLFFSRASLASVGLLFAHLATTAQAISPVFENSGIVRSVELGGSLTSTSTTYAVKALKDDANAYIITMSEDEFAVTSFVSAKIKGQTRPLVFSLLGHDKVK